MKYLITGGTGTIGSALLDSLLYIRRDVYSESIQGTEPRLDLNELTSEVRIFSRDETKQHAMKLSVRDDRVRYFIGDVRNRDSIYDAMLGIDIVYHAAAMKHVWSCEEFPMQAIETNVTGTANVIDCAIKCSVSKLVLVSSDKAVNPVGVMGATKMLAEKILEVKAESSAYTELFSIRLANLINSRGSVLEVWRKQLSEGVPCTLTEPDATRFFMTVHDAVEMIKNAGTCKTPKMKSCSVWDLWLAFSNNRLPYKIIGLQPGERIHEYMDEETCSADAKRFTVEQLKEMI